MLPRILQLGNTGGIAWQLGRGFVALGSKSIVVELEPSSEGFPADLRIHMNPPTSYPRRIVRFIELVRQAQVSDIVHFHFGIRPFAKYLRRFCDAPFFVHYHGSDLREHMADGLRDMAVGEFVATPDLTRWAPRATWVPNPFPLPDVSEYPPTKRVVVGHFPSDPAKKGTRIIQEAVDTLKRDFDFDFALILGRRHQEVLDAIQRCHIVIDQLSELGVYGMVAVEGMAYGRVVLSSIDSNFYDRCPIIPIARDNLVSRLADALASSADFEILGTAGREYVARVHAPTKVARLVMMKYGTVV